MGKTLRVAATIGFIIWLLCLIMLGMSTIERLLLFAMLVTVPLTLALTETRDRDGRLFKSYRLAVTLYPVAAFLALLSFFYPPGLTAGLLSFGWLLWTVHVASYGFLRFLARGPYLLEECCLDAGLLYVALGGIWFSIFQLGINVLNFGSVIILLTAIHFHFSALVTPVFVGLVGRVLRVLEQRLRLLYRFMAIGIMISSLGIAIGITFSRVIEFIFVALFVSSLWLYAYVTIVTIRTAIMNRFAYVLLAISSASLLFTMLFAFYYGIGRLVHIDFVSIPDMVWLHGVGNAFGFVFVGVIAWLLNAPMMSRNPYGIPFSTIYGRWTIGADFFKRRDVMMTKSDKYSGLIDEWTIFEQRTFHPNRIDARIRDFYTNTLNYQLRSSTYWYRGFRTLARFYKKLSTAIEQINLPLHHEDDNSFVDSQIIALNSEKDGRRHVRAWIRTSNQTKKAVFVAAYSSHEFEGDVYLNIALPLPGGQMTGMLRFENHDEQALVLTSHARKNRKGDEGIYYVTRWFSVLLPLNERFLVWIADNKSDMIKAHHQMTMFGFTFLSIDYTIEKQEE